MTEHCQETAPLIDYDCPRFGSTWNFIFFSGLDLQDQLSCFFFFVVVVVAFACLFPFLVCFFSLLAAWLQNFLMGF